VDVIAGRWEGKDAGIWELDDDWWTHSRLACAAGLKSYAPHVGSAEADRMRELAAAILARTTDRCLHADGRWQRTPKDKRVDAALVLPPLRGALDAADPRTLATLDAVRHDLVDDWYVYRYRPESGELGDDEGAFLLCGFLLSLAEWQQGNLVAAFRAFERNRAACGPPGLLAEEFDVDQRQLRGNLPQAFVHATLLEASVRLGEA
jgi:GH15 family glucan-1,4-alpha-glucosidase